MRPLIAAGVVLALACTTIFFWRDVAQRNAPRSLVHYELRAIKQSAAMNCWSATYAMLVSWQSRREVAESEAIIPLGDPWVGYQVSGSGLPSGQEREFVHATGLVAEGPADFDLEAFVGMLKAFGPLWVTTGDGLSSHARLMVGVYGEGLHDYQGAKFIFIDPEDGNTHEVSALTFLQEFEKEARVVVSSGSAVDLRFQIIHWPAAKSSQAGKSSRRAAAAAQFLNDVTAR